MNRALSKEKVRPLALVPMWAVSWAITTDPSVRMVMVTEENGRATISVQDDGIGLPDDFDFERVTTLGLQLVNLLAEELHGAVQINRQKGTRFTVSFPPR